MQTPSTVPKEYFDAAMAEIGSILRSHTEQPEEGTGESVISYTLDRVIGHGSFGVVFSATVQSTNETVAIKKVLQSKKHKNRELELLRALHHPHIVRLKHYFFSGGDTPTADLHVNLVLQYYPDTVYRFGRHFTRQREAIPLMYVKLFSFQLARALAYLHSDGINVAHRDVKLSNLLLDPASGLVALADFGSAKTMNPDEESVSYICSRYFRAPELIFGSTNYTTAVDIWSYACVLGELFSGTPVFTGASSVDQLVEIVKILGTPSKSDVDALNPNYTELKFPAVRPFGFAKIFRSMPSEAVDLISKLFVYNPSQRLSPLSILCHPFFNELRQPNCRLPTGKPLPDIFQWTPEEMTSMTQQQKDILLRK